MFVENQKLIYAKMVVLSCSTNTGPRKLDLRQIFSCLTQMMMIQLIKKDCRRNFKWTYNHKVEFLFSSLSAHEIKDKWDILFFM